MSVADFGFRVNHVKLLISYVLQKLWRLSFGFLGFAAAAGGGGGWLQPGSAPLGAPLSQRDIGTLYRVFKSWRCERACRNELHKTRSTQVRLWHSLFLSVTHTASQISCFILVWCATATQPPGTRSPGRLNFVRWRLVFVGPQCVTGSVSHLRLPEL
jgi:hypothetical protein